MLRKLDQRPKLSEWDLVRNDTSTLCFEIDCQCSAIWKAIEFNIHCGSLVAEDQLIVMSFQVYHSSNVRLPVLDSFCWMIFFLNPCPTVCGLVGRAYANNNGFILTIQHVSWMVFMNLMPSSEIGFNNTQVPRVKFYSRSTIMGGSGMIAGGCNYQQDPCFSGYQ